MNGMNGLGGWSDGLSDGMGGGLSAELAWLLFAESGNPGLYMLYSDLRKGEDRGIFD